MVIMMMVVVVAVVVLMVLRILMIPSLKGITGSGNICTPHLTLERHPSATVDKGPNQLTHLTELSKPSHPQALVLVRAHHPHRKVVWNYDRPEPDSQARCGDRTTNVTRHHRKNAKKKKKKKKKKKSLSFCRWVGQNIQHMSFPH
ncbi:hypothetical protein PoB_005911800 [Plakobranchus ocellatus]|uniref:Secreted protein n=1 Tax=Plakobranchus ocellatus TaxID=259542 RepID=A0AAV4CLG4_9GAST|nr:hypothetical protein PoB_005911800 [Plakobranchus ocellatus]